MRLLLLKQSPAQASLRRCSWRLGAGFAFLLHYLSYRPEICALLQANLHLCVSLPPAPKPNDLSAEFATHVFQFSLPSPGVQKKSLDFLTGIPQTSGLPQGLGGKESACKAGATGDMGSILGWGRSPGRGHGNPRQCSSLEDPMGRGAWRAKVHRVAKSRTQLK